MPTATRTRIDDLIAAANTILDRTPDNEWWQMRPLEVVAFAFPDWEIVAAQENANYNRCTVSYPSALLRHRTDASQWLYIYARGKELLPGRMSTMGQFFRFKNLKNEFAVGTPDDIVATISRRFHPDAQRGILWWLLDQFTHAHPTPTPGWTFEATTQAPLWALFTAADTNLRRARSDGTDTPQTTHETLTRAFPDWSIVGLREHDRYRTRALLHSQTTDDQWLYLTSWDPALLAIPDDGTGPVLRAKETAGRAHTNGLLGTSDELLTVARHRHELWPTTTDAYWLLHHLSLAHPNPETATAYRTEVASEQTLKALSNTPHDDKVYTELCHLLA